uniref:histidine--tRNA ligase n=1 Tax=Rhodymenia pseudopalmata TaxID=31502 RepID=A0A1C9C7S5_RHOPU|nr:histidine-tRNA synthetase [Rhodymenia pseudopalmata]AOM64423.1 histidine-tRNA synthetase [Rhodymenia pseudopalmata]
MQPLRGTKDILPSDVTVWQYIYQTTLEILSLCSYQEIRTPIIESNSLFQRSIGNATDIVNKEMYTFMDQGERRIALRPEGTASIARSFISNKLYQDSKVKRLWYFGPMFRYERPQNGRQRQFHQLGIECIGSIDPIADTEVIRLANKILHKLGCSSYKIEINSIGNTEERFTYKQALIEYLLKYEKDLDKESRKRLEINPFRILDSKNKKTQEILNDAPRLNDYLNTESLNHFDAVCENLNYLNIEYSINNKLVRGLDYYNYTAFEMKSKELGSQDTICGGGRYDKLIKQLGGPDTPAVGWAIGIERLLLVIQNTVKTNKKINQTYIATQGSNAKQRVWDIIHLLEKEKISFELDLSNSKLIKQIKKAYKSEAKICLILGDKETANENITLKWLNENHQETISIANLIQKLRDVL